MVFLVLKDIEINNENAIEKQGKLKRDSYIWGTSILTVLSAIVWFINLIRYATENKEFKNGFCKSFLNTLVT